MKILLISAEVAPFAKVGELADVAGALPKALRELGHDVRVAMPCYKMIETNPAYAVSDLLSKFAVPIREGLTEQAFVKQTRICSTGGDIPVLLIGNRRTDKRPGFFAEATDSSKIYSLTPQPYVFFCRAVMEALRRLPDGWRPDVLHCNDWQSGLVPTLVRTEYARDNRLKGLSTLFTIHNLAYQGNFDRSDWPATGLPDSLYSVDALEYYGGWSFMKGGITFADRINTVSETYSREIQTAEYGCGLDGLMRTLAKSGRLSGIVNGIDYEEFNPKTDPRIAAHFDARNLTGKRRDKEALQEDLRLNRDPSIPLVGMVSRLADQKGLDLIRAVIERLLALPIQFALLGAGDKGYERFFRDLQDRFPDQVHARIGFDTDLAQKIYAGSDMFLMPSRFEPCGLGQLIALRYGTIPIVRSTGGLADTIRGYGSGNSADANGFSFEEYSSEALFATTAAAARLYHEPVNWKRLVARAIQNDFSWGPSAVKYESLYCDGMSAPRLAGRRPLAQSDAADALFGLSGDR